MLTIRELIKTLYNAFNQKLKKYRGNWDQNDPTADDYIKNRPFYTDGYITIINNKTFTTTLDYEWCSPFVFELVDGEIYKVIWNGKEYECIAVSINGGACIGNISLVEDGKNTGEPFIYAYMDYGDGDIEYFWYIKNAGTHFVSIYKQNVKKIDKKYLPDNNNSKIEAAIDDLYDYANSLDNSIANIPTDVVRYGVQSLTDAQKTTARTNIGAISYETQTLTAAQQQQARNNIGAPDKSSTYSTVKYVAQSLSDAQKKIARTNISASDFSGDYNDLTNKPTDSVKYSVQTLSDSEKLQARKNIGAGTSDFNGDYESLKNKPFGEEILIPETEPNYEQLNSGYPLVRYDENGLLVRCNDGEFFYGSVGGAVTSGGIRKLMIDLCNPFTPTWLPCFSSVTAQLTVGGIYNFVAGDDGGSVRLAEPHESIYRTMRVVRINSGSINAVDVPATIIPDTIPIIPSAQVGQTIAVKSVDENGMPTEWEAVSPDYATKSDVANQIAEALSAFVNGEEVSY